VLDGTRTYVEDSTMLEATINYRRTHTFQGVFCCLDTTA